MTLKRLLFLGVLTGLLACLFTGLAPLAPEAVAQSWLPWATREEPVRRPPPRREPAPPPQSFGGQGYAQQPQSGGGSICLQLEQRLADYAMRHQNSAQTRANLENSLRAAQRDLRRAERELDRRDCYESFLFTRSLRPSPTCRRLDRDFRDAERRAEGASIELRNLDSGRARERQDEIIRALARNGCGEQYVREARRRDNSGGFWQDSESDGYGGQGNVFGGLPFATYRTLCVRLCDGYYFPVSFSTLPNHFDRDEEVCQQRCAAPTELYFHQNPGGSIDQMISRRSQQPYTTLTSAFRYRKEFVAGCSCKASEYIPQTAAGGPVTSSLPPAQATNPNAGKFSPIR